MADTVIHPGEHLAEELEALDMSAAELARKLARAHQSRHADFEWHSLCDGRYGVASRSLPSAPARNFGSICKIFMT